MKALILAGGYGTRISELTQKIPKPMIPIGEYPILAHIMSHYSFYGVNDFLILGGYKVNEISKFFLREGAELISRNSWKVEVADTGEATSTGGRLLAVKNLVPEQFMLTYGDGLSDVNISELYRFHLNEKRIATVTAVRPPARFGTIEFKSGLVTNFSEKDPQKVGWINGGFFCFSKRIFDYLGTGDTSLESEPMKRLVLDHALSAYSHEGFWLPMDTLRDHQNLCAEWAQGTAKWNYQALKY